MIIMCSKFVVLEVNLIFAQLFGVSTYFLNIPVFLSNYFEFKNSFKEIKQWGMRLTLLTCLGALIRQFKMHPPLGLLDNTCILFTHITIIFL